MTKIKVGNTTVKIYQCKGQLKPDSKTERYEQFVAGRFFWHQGGGTYAPRVEGF